MLILVQKVASPNPELPLPPLSLFKICRHSRANCPKSLPISLSLSLITPSTFQFHTELYAGSHMYSGFSNDSSPPILGQNSSPNSSFVPFLNSQNSSYIRVSFSNTLSQISSLFPCYSSRISGRCFALKVSEQKLGFSQTILAPMANTSCGGTELETCRDETEALVLKFIAIASILMAGVVGIAIPLVGKNSRFLRTDSNLFVIAKSFAAGVILATGFVHMLSAGSKALYDPCLPEYPWSKFPFAGFFAMTASLLTLLVDFVGTQYYERKQGLARGTEEIVRVGSADAGLESGISPAGEGKECNGKVFGEEEGGGMHIVGMHAHAAHHRHSHPHGQDACDGHRRDSSHGHGHSHGFEDADGEEDAGVRHVVVSQILELGIVSHSVIIGLSLGVSQSPCTIRPLIAALSFHQFFEGFALGGCISQAQFNNLSATLMACFFAITTPAGIGIGIAISSVYNPNSAGALVTEGILDSMSAGILVYMALVDLIAADFLSKRMSCNFRLQVVSYFMLFLGAGLMSLLAIWA